MMTCQDAFVIFSNFDFLCCYWGKSAEMALNDKKNISVLICNSGTVPLMFVVFVTHV